MSDYDTDKYVKDADFVYSLAKGRMAESIFEELFKKLGYMVARSGQEVKFPEVMNSKGLPRNNPAYKTIKELPDFIVHKGDFFYHFEIRYRTEEYLLFDKISQMYLESTYYVLFSPKNIYCLNPEQIKNLLKSDGNKILFTQLLENCPDFNFKTEDYELVKAIRRMSVNLFVNLPVAKSMRNRVEQKTIKVPTG